MFCFKSAKPFLFSRTLEVSGVRARAGTSLTGRKLLDWLALDGQESVLISVLSTVKLNAKIGLLHRLAF